jgi:hypothetical protein
MKARRDNGEQDPWSKEKKADEKKKAFVNRFRLANFVSSDHLRSAVLQFGRALTKEGLDEGKKTNQKLYELVCSEYNKTSVDEYLGAAFPGESTRQKLAIQFLSN